MRDDLRHHRQDDRLGRTAGSAAQIDHHSVVVKDFGKIFFGEILITSSSRRLTMMRLELGSDDGGTASGPDVDINGSWS